MTADRRPETGDDTERSATGGHGREGREPSDAEPREGGEDWKEQSGYGERVLDSDDGDRAAEEQAEDAETVEEHR